MYVCVCMYISLISERLYPLVRSEIYYYKTQSETNSYVKCLKSTIMFLVTTSHKNEFELRDTYKN